MVALASDARGAAASYWAKSRAPRYSLVFALPLLLFYEALAASVPAAAGASVRNAADVLLKTPFFLISGARGTLAFFATIVAACIFLVARDLTRNRERLRPRIFLLMLGESALLALVLGLVVSSLTARLLGALTIVTQTGAGGAAAIESMGVGTRLMLALGAGLYEELLFRVLLVGGIAAGLRWLLGSKSLVAGAIAAVVGALTFSAFHYVGEYGDQFTASSFVYRFIAGLVFSALYLLRGFGITAWSHALYDVYVMVL